jgi:hypothetical protein
VLEKFGNKGSVRKAKGSGNTTTNSDSHMVFPTLTSPLNQTTPYVCRRLAGALKVAAPYAELGNISGWANAMNAKRKDTRKKKSRTSCAANTILID